MAMSILIQTVVYGCLHAEAELVYSLQKLKRFLNAPYARGWPLFLSA